MGKTYLIGKIGKSVKFNPKSWGPIGGDSDAPILFKKLAEINPDDTFILIGKSDLEKQKELQNLPKNLYSIYDGCNKDDKKDYEYVNNKLKDIKIDGCFLIAGPTANCNIPKKSYKRNELKKGIKTFGKSLFVFENYVAPIYHFLNESNIDWILLAHDPRYIKQGNDLLNQPKLVLSQFNETVKMQCFDNFEDQNYITNDIDCIYSGLEKTLFIDSEIKDANQFEKNTKLMIPLNEGNNGVKSRYSELKKYVLDYIDDVEIYGKWDEKTVNGDSRFKGSMNYHELQHKLEDVKYSFIISISPGWVTAKVWELLVHGVIPFMHPQYDTQNNTKVHDFIRIKDPMDLHRKIEFLEENPDKRKKLINALLSLIDEDDISGKRLSDIILSNTPAINKNGIEFSENQSNKQSKQSIDEW